MPGAPVTVYEAGPAAGGRCRSYHDKELGCRIDNGNHLWLSGNRSIAGFLRRVGAEGTLAGPATAMFPFHDLATGRSWTVRPNAGPVPWWVLAPGRGVPGARLRDYAGLLRLLRAGPDATVAEVMRPGALNDRLIEPLVIAALNTAPATGSAALMAAVMRETLARGGQACVPAFPRDGLSASFIDPAVDALLAGGRGPARRPPRVRGDGGRRPGGGARDGGRADPARPAGWRDPCRGRPGGAGLAARACRRRTRSRRSSTCITAMPPRPDRLGSSDLLGGTAEWVFIKPEVVSVTISAANRLVDRAAE